MAVSGGPRVYKLGAASDSVTGNVQGFVWTAKGAIDDDLVITIGGDEFALVGGVVNHSQYIDLGGIYTTIAITTIDAGSLYVIMSVGRRQ